jgi:hypothetical protein
MEDERRTVPFGSASGGATEVAADRYDGAFDPDRFRPQGDQWRGGMVVLPPALGTR